MRLTLRTLLAYLDDVLDPADKEELARKIESSELAEELVHRTRDVMRRLRLSAPQVIGTGMALDPNTVAEYLDNVLPPDQVGEFERICLESDVHLAEAAACHHVLTMVLGEPAEVDPRSRQRMYRILTESRERKLHRAEPAHVPAAARAATPTTGPAVSPAEARPAQTPRAIEVPEYLRTRPWWQSSGVLVALAGVLLVGAALLLASGLRGWFGQTTAPSVVAMAEPGVSTATPSTQAGALPPETPPQPLTPGLATAPTNIAETTDPYAMPSESSESVGPTNVPGAAEEKIATPLQPAPTAPQQETRTDVVPPQSHDGTATTDTVASPSLPTPLPDVPLPAEVAVTEPAETPSALIPPPVTSEVTAETKPDATAVAALSPPTVPEIPVEAQQPPAVTVTPTEPKSSGPIVLGTYLSPRTVLLRFDEASGAWFRMEPRQSVTAGQRLLALPEFRPTITLLSGVHIDLLGGTQVTLTTGDTVLGDGLPESEVDTPAMEVGYGRVVLANRSNRDNSIRLKLGANVADAHLSPNATLAIELERQYVPGNDPREVPAPLVVRLYAPQGGVEWHDSSARTRALANAHWTITNDEVSEMATDAPLPEWIDQEPALGPSEQLQQLAAPRIEGTLVSNRPVDIQLLEMYESNVRREVKALVARCSIHVGMFEPFISTLRDSSQRWPTWESHIQTLRAAMALSPESAEKVWQTLVQQRGEAAAADLYEMLCGYNLDQIGRTPEQWKTRALARLIDWLEEDSLDYRVLAVQNLYEITGKRLMSDPAARVRDREKNVRVWRQRLNEGSLKPKVAGESDERQKQEQGQ